jgi:hypothetical protein
MGELGASPVPKGTAENAPGLASWATLSRPFGTQYAALDRNACAGTLFRAALFKESRMKLREPTKLHRKSGMWGTRLLVRG